MSLETTSGRCLPAVEMFSNKTRKLRTECLVLLGAGPGPARSRQRSSRCARAPLVRCRSSPRGGPGARSSRSQSCAVRLEPTRRERPLSPLLCGGEGRSPQA